MAACRTPQNLLVAAHFPELGMHVGDGVACHRPRGNVPPRTLPNDVSNGTWVFPATYLTMMRENAPQRHHALRESFNGPRTIAIILDSRTLQSTPEHGNRADRVSCLPCHITLVNVQDREVGLGRLWTTGTRGTRPGRPPPYTASPGKSSSCRMSSGASCSCLAAAWGNGTSPGCAASGGWRVTTSGSLKGVPPDCLHHARVGAGASVLSVP